MKKFVFDNLNDAARMIAMVSKEKSAVVLTLGVKEIENSLVCMIRCTAQNRQIVMRLLCEKPKDWDSKPVQLVLKTQDFVSVVQTLTAYKDAKMYLAVGEKDVFLGVEKKAKIRVNLLSEVPQEIKSGKVIAQFTAGDGFEAFLRKGCGCAKQELDATRLLHNTVLVLNTGTGELSALSTDAIAMARAKTTVQMAKAAENNDVAKKRVEEIEQNLTAFCEEDEKQSKEALMLCVPTESIQLIRQLTAGVKNIGVIADEKHLLVQAGPNVMLTVARGTGTALNPGTFEQLLLSEGEVVCAVDVESLLRGVNLCNKVGGINGYAEKVIDIVIKKDAITMSIGDGKTKDAETKIPILGKKGEDADVRIDGARLEPVLSMLDKGGMLLRILQKQFMLFSNGNLQDGADNTANLALGLIRKGVNAKEEEKDPEEAEASEGEEAKAEGIAA